MLNPEYGKEKARKREENFNPNGYVDLEELHSA